MTSRSRKQSKKNIIPSRGGIPNLGKSYVGTVVNRGPLLSGFSPQLTWMRFAHVIHQSLLADEDLGGVHVRDDRTQDLRQRNELGLGYGGHLQRRQVAWNTSQKPQIVRWWSRTQLHLDSKHPPPLHSPHICPQTTS